VPVRAAAAIMLAVGVLVLAGCGSGDGGFAIVVNFGVIAATPACDGDSGEFPLEQAGGLVVIVIVNDQTEILLASGGRGTCADLRAGLSAEVRGAEERDRITAERVTIQGS
jgi:hypothetical protein